ncbi:MAG: T9SS C-terminal target domain-containing protein [Calditrichaeota bacterium]|nr:MAG: T9SS C-terminal target domain-containing protein [Calditrichota bacterium]
MRKLSFKLATGIMAIIFTVLLQTSGVNAQGNWHHGDGNQYSWPDSLQTETYTGTIIVDSTFFHPLYYLDTDGDRVAEYQLMFGPWWYTPENGAEWPGHGDSITIVGAATTMMMNQTSTSIVVFEINGVRWREPIAVGGHGWNMGNFWDMNADTLTVNGTVFVDSTYYYPVYFLDTNADSLPDYRLSFGPPWFEPSNGAVRPLQSDVVTIFGRTHIGMMGYETLMVSRINDLEWQPLNGPASWAGSWMPRNHADSSFIFCANDSSNWLSFAPGHMGGGMGGMHGMRWPDSTFVQFWEIYPDSLPGDHTPGNFMGFYVNIHDPMGSTMMGGSSWGGNNWGGHHGMMNFEKSHRFLFQYTNDDLHRNNLEENSIALHYWDTTQNTWKIAADAVVNVDKNTVTLTSSEINTYYALRASETTTAVQTSDIAPASFKLLANYPNPFNPETTVAFELAERSPVRLEIYNLLGQHLATLINEVRDAGSYQMIWNGRDAQNRQLSSGIYLLKMQVNTQSTVRRMTLLK